MKKVMVFALACLVGGIASAQALTDADLAPTTVRANMKAQTTATAKSAYAAKVIKAINAKDISADEKAAQIAEVTKALIREAGDDSLTATIGATYSFTDAYALAAVSKDLQKGFSQVNNKKSDEAYDALAKKIVEESADYINTADTDNKTFRMAVLTSTFIDSATDRDRVKEVYPESLPAGRTAAAAAMIATIHGGDKEEIAALIGGDGEDVANPPAAKAGTANPPLLSRSSRDEIGITFDTMTASLNNLSRGDEDDNESISGPTDVGPGVIDDVPGLPDIGLPEDKEEVLPSPGYPGQGFIY